MSSARGVCVLLSAGAYLLPTMTDYAICFDFPEHPDPWFAAPLYTYRHGAWDETGGCAIVKYSTQRCAVT